MKCAIYTRVSTDNQAGKEFNSCEAQFPLLSLRESGFVFRSFDKLKICSETIVVIYSSYRLLMLFSLPLTILLFVALFLMLLILLSKIQSILEIPEACNEYIYLRFHHYAT